jgi:DNA primase catalytic core, N-terminal domain
LTRRSSRGIPIDYFRHRVMLVIRDEHGKVAGLSAGRTQPPIAVLKYLNRPDTPRAACCSAFLKVAAGAAPVIVKGLFDPVTAPDPARYAG